MIPTFDVESFIHPIGMNTGAMAHVEGGLTTVYNAASLVKYRHPLEKVVAICAGAYNGMYPAYLAALGFKAVFAFEPFRTTYELAVENLEMHPLLSKRVRLSPHALSDRDGSMFMAPMPGNPGATRVSPTKTMFAAVTTTIDQELEYVKDEVGLLILDVEGMETLALKGARQVIYRDMPVVMLEQNDVGAVEYLEDAFDYKVHSKDSWVPHNVLMVPPHRGY